MKVQHQESECKCGIGIQMITRMIKVEMINQTDRLRSAVAQKGDVTAVRFLKNTATEKLISKGQSPTYFSITSRVRMLL